jgi:hypothetical protein
MPKYCQHDACKKALPMAAFPCKCQNFYCALHRSNYDHLCSFDYKNEHKSTIMKHMSVAVIAQKVAII